MHNQHSVVSHAHMREMHGILPRILLAFFLTGFVLFLASLPRNAHAGALLISPNGGTFTVGSTFDVQLILDTEGESVNALDVDLQFPPDKLQLVSPNTSVSVISLWTSQPQFNNQTGRVRLQGGIPRGINVKSALVATLTFRVKSIGTAIVRFTDQSRVLLNDGLGTDDLNREENAVYELVLPPPAGPTVISETHPDQSEWYSNSNVVFKWAVDDPVQNYSYVYDTEPVTNPDDSPDGTRTTVVYKNVPEGKHYFHIKALRGGAWGGVTHFGTKIDTEAPAQFPLEILPGKRTNARDIVVKFLTTDTLSGIDHYELKFVPLTPTSDGDVGDQPLFIEAQSPYIAPELAEGAYDIFVRAFDHAGNYREVVDRLVVTDQFFGFTTRDGFILGEFVLNWWWLFLVLLIIILTLLWLAKHYRNRHKEVHDMRESGAYPEAVNLELRELERYRTKYGSLDTALSRAAQTDASDTHKIPITGLLLVAALLGSMALFAAPSPRVYAQVSEDQGPAVELAPPYITTISRSVTNNEIFYVGGKTELSDMTVTIYAQNLSTGETTSYSVLSDKKGEWFYRHNNFLSPGKYVLWTQASLGDITSPPSPQIEMSVARAAIVFGVTRVSYEAIYLLALFLLLAIIALLTTYLGYHIYHHRQKHRLLQKEVRDVEESVRRGFAIIRRDIERELAVLKRGRTVESLTAEERAREAELYRDLKDAERRIGKEVWDIARAEEAA